MKLKIVEDSRGKAAGVFIPINDWEKLKKQYKSLKELEYREPNKKELLHELKQAVRELKLIEYDKLKVRPASELLNELKGFIYPSF